MSKCSYLNWILLHATPSARYKIKTPCLQRPVTVHRWLAAVKLKGGVNSKAEDDLQSLHETLSLSSQRFWAAKLADIHQLPVVLGIAPHVFFFFFFFYWWNQRKSTGCPYTFFASSPLTNFQRHASPLLCKHWHRSSFQLGEVQRGLLARKR